MGVLVNNSLKDAREGVLPVPLTCRAWRDILPRLHTLPQPTPPCAVMKMMPFWSSVMEATRTSFSPLNSGKSEGKSGDPWKSEETANPDQAAAAHEEGTPLILGDWSLSPTPMSEEIRDVPYHAQDRERALGACSTVQSRCRRPKSTKISFGLPMNIVCGAADRAERAVCGNRMARGRSRRPVVPSSGRSSTPRRSARRE